MGHYAKPGNEKPYRAEYSHNAGWQVIGPDNVVIGGTYASKNAACAAAGGKNQQAVRAAKRMTRPCMSCRNPFESEGIHNRLCPRCRLSGSAEAMPAGYSFGAMTGRKRA